MTITVTKVGQIVALIFPLAIMGSCQIISNFLVKLYDKRFTDVIISCYFGEVAELVEGAPLLREYGVKSSIEGSNPSLSVLLRARSSVG